MKDLLSAAKDSLSFLIVCVAIFAALVVIAWLAQRYLCRSMPKCGGTRYVAMVAMFSALAGVLMLFEIPLFFAPSFYEMDRSEIPILLCSFYFGAGVRRNL